MTNLQAKILSVYKSNPTQTLEVISVKANSSIRYASMTINDFKEFGEPDEELFLVPSKDSSLVGVFYLFTDSLEKTVRTSKYKIQNSEDFTKNELNWLEKNYNFKSR